MKNTKEINLFIDMDGTTAQFYESASCLEEMYNDHFFLHLNPYKNVIRGLTKLVRKLKQDEQVVNVYTLSAVPVEIADKVKEDKLQWIQTYFPIVKSCNALFLNIGTNKAETIKNLLGVPIDENCYLLDDYNKNLHEWKSAGGTSIKLVNEINDKGTNGPLWIGPRIRYDFPEDRICDELKGIILN